MHQSADLPPRRELHDFGQLYTLEAVRPRFGLVGYEVSETRRKLRLGLGLLVRFPSSKAVFLAGTCVGRLPRVRGLSRDICTGFLEIL